MIGERTIFLVMLGIIVLAGIAGAILNISNNKNELRNRGSVQNFGECVAAGFPVMESYPRQCRSADGQLFVEDVSVPRNALGTSTSTTECVPAGCSGQLCVDAAEAGGITTTCEFRLEYACYRNADCARQPDGQCGWTPTDELSRCLLESRGDQTD